ncbi:MAG: hypothetical protein OEY61_05750 [Gammaproteobacteria bacterium]|nr:hypothetical protein [Gammaproteobacteria bacterium]
MLKQEFIHIDTDTRREADFHNLGINLDDLVRITFLEQSAKYFGVYVNKDQFDNIDDDKYFIN